MKTCEKVTSDGPDADGAPHYSVSDVLRCSSENGAERLPAQVLLGSSALMQPDVDLTEAACPLTKSNYEHHAGGKAAASVTGFDPQAACLNHSSPPLQTGL